MKNLALALSALVLAGIIGFLYFDQPQHPNRLTELRKKTIRTSAEMAELRTLSRIEKRASGWAKPDKPEEFVTYYNVIRTAEGEISPSYAANYRLEELAKAKISAKKSFHKKGSSLTWTERGPWNNGGRTRGLLIDPDDNTHSTWFAGSVGGGIWKTTNSGDSWVDITPDLPNIAVTSLAMPASNPQVIYAGTGEGFGNFDAIKGDGIFKSTDKGQTWIQLSSTAKNTAFSYVNRIIVDPDNADILIVATRSGIYRTENGGESFAQVYSNSNSTLQIVVQESNFNIQYAAVDGFGVVRSVDGGKTWLAKGTGLPAGGRIEISVTALDTALIYASVESGTESDLYRSVNAGQSWSFVGIVTGYESWLGEQGWYDNTITVHPFNKNSIYVGGIDLYRIDIGASTKQTKLTHWYEGTGLPYVHADKHGLYTAILNESAKTFRLISTNDGGVEYSDDEGITWNKTLNGYLTTQFYGADKAPGSDRYFGGTQDNGSWLSPLWTSVTNNWETPLGGDGFASVWHHQNPNKLMGSLYNNILYRSSDGGNSWEEMSGVPQTGPFVTWIGESNIDPDLVFVFNGEGAYRTDNFGDTWDLIPIKSNWGFNGTSGKIEISKHNPQIVWAGIGMNTGTTPRSLQVSVDGGLSFTAVPNFANIGYLSGLATDPLRDSVAYAMFSVSGLAKVLKTENLGKTWTDLSKFSGGVSQNGFPNVATYSLVVMPHNPSEIWVGTEIGLFISTDAGATWSYSDNGFPAVAIWDMKIVDDQVVVATHGRGLWTATIPELLTVPLPQAIKAPRILAANPDFKGQIKVSLNLPETYDSTFIFVNSAKFLKLPDGGPRNVTVVLNDLPEGIVSIQVSGFKNNWNYRSSVAKAAKINLLEPVSSYTSNMNESADFSNFVVSQTNGSSDFIHQKPTGYLDKGLSTRHPYSENSEKTALLKVPVIIKGGESILKFKNIAIVETGEPGSVYGDEDFYDYVIVEGTKNGFKWLPLGNGYDASKYPEWLSHYNNNPGGTPSKDLFKTEAYNLLSVFAPGDTVVLRWRLFSDPYTAGWGWIIDDIEIQGTLVSVDEEGVVPIEFSLAQNYPNPFNPTTAVSYTVAQQGLVYLSVYDALGRQIETLVNQQQTPGSYTVHFNGEGKSSGIYFVKMTASGFTSTRKMMLLK
ncbi:MAG: T9SS type A sorting domain-containing protein [Bacteroidetes bacterium]|nr:T9SS type A sorting domain-containing protein [Bacteroidota bacterium]